MSRCVLPDHCSKRSLHRICKKIINRLQGIFMGMGVHLGSVFPGRFPRLPGQAMDQRSEQKTEF